MCFDDLSGHLHVTLHKGFEPLCDKEQRSGGGGGGGRWGGGGEKDLTPCSLCKFLLQSSRSGDVSVKAARLIKIQLVIILLQLIALFLSPTQSQPNTHTVTHAQTHTLHVSL